MLTMSSTIEPHGLKVSSQVEGSSSSNRINLSKRVSSSARTNSTGRANSSGRASSTNGNAKSSHQRIKAGVLGLNSSGGLNSGSATIGSDGVGWTTALAVSSKWHIEVARPGDHHIACQLLAGVQRAPSATEFQSQLEDPFCEPNDRLLCRLHDSLVGHVRLVKREMRFGSATLPVANLADLLVLPEHRQQGCGSALLSACEQKMVADGTLLGIVRTQQPHFFLRRGWCVWTRHSYSTAGAREILSQLLESRPKRTEEDLDTSSAINIRWWRHIELTGMIRLYNESIQHGFGPLVRSEAYWQWLLSRRAFDRIYVALLGPDRFELDHGAAAMVGYAVMKEGRILELIASPAVPRAAEELLARACSDTIEQDGNYVRLEAPVGDPLHLHMARAGGELGYHESQNGEVCLVKVLDIPTTIERFNEHFHERARSAGLELPLELGLHVAGEKFTLEVRPRCVKLRTGRPCRSYLTCGSSELTQLLLGHLDLKVAVSSGRVCPSTRIALETASVLFPKLPLWRPPWDELQAK
jgi:GNAT superfamily N-acetyltransferase